ncbi:MAG: serine protease [Treponema sp.]|nr:serine protease [Treponema sp.]
MLNRSVFFILVFAVLLPFQAFSQQGAAALRDYVGLINQSYHPGIVSFFEKVKAQLAKQNETNAVKNIDIFLRGGFGSGFLYSDRGNLYIITNNHVVAQAHTLSITFERSDGTTRKIDDLKIIAADEENDLAILSIPAGGVRPYVNQGLTLITRQAEEGEDVFSAGFPGLGATPIWQFGRGMVSNAAARFPKTIHDEKMMGPFIQHTAQVDSGNSGGPLLMAQRNAPSGYAVIGINTLKATSRQAANYAIPIRTVQTFISDALNQRAETFRAALDQRLEKFIEGLGVNAAVYPHISEYLSAACIGENAEFAFEQMYAKAGRNVQKAFIEKCEESVISAMGIAVAWTIENNLRNAGALKVTLKEIEGSGDEYTVTFLANNKEVSSVWIREYGNWRIKSFGTVATGDTERLKKNQTARESSANLRTDGIFYIEAGYAYLFKKSPAAFYAAVDVSYFGANFYINDEFLNLGLFASFKFPIPVGKVAFIPFIKAGFSYSYDFNNVSDLPEFDFLLGFALSGHVGLRFTTSYVPGLTAGVGFQYNLNFMNLFGNSNLLDPFTMGLQISVGYAF